MENTAKNRTPSGNNTPQATTGPQAAPNGQVGASTPGSQGGSQGGEKPSSKSGGAGPPLTDQPPTDGTQETETEYRQVTFEELQNSKFAKRPKTGAPRENRNAIRHGLRTGKLPKSARFIEHRLNAFRRQLEDALLELKGEVSITDAANIQTCCRWERHAALAQHWLSKKHEEMKPEQLLYFSREIARASSERDRALRALGLDRDLADSLKDVLYQQPKRIDEGGD